MNFQTEICTFKTADNERLHGALFTPPERPSDLALLFVHGVAMNFYLPPLFTFRSRSGCSAAITALSSIRAAMTGFPAPAI